MLALILIPFALWEEPINAWSARLLTPAAGRATVALLVVLLLASDVVLPIPSSFVSAGAVALLGAWQGGLTIALGMTVAAWLGYGIGRFGGEPLARRMAGPAELERARAHDGALRKLGRAGVSRRAGAWPKRRRCWRAPRA